MKKRKWFALCVLVLFVVAGCASTAGFNKTYMPKAVPDKPDDKIALTSEDSRVVLKYLSQKKLTNHAGLYWLAEDTIYLSLEESAIFGIDMKTKSARELLGTEADEAKKMIAGKLNVALDNEGRGMVRQFAASVFSYMGHKFTGDLTDNQHKIGVDIKAYENRDPSNSGTCESAKLKGQLTNGKGKITDVEWNYHCDWVTQVVTLKKVPQLLSGLQISPSGKYYLYRSLLYNVDANRLVCDLLKDYPGTLAVSVNPDWSKMAVLKGKGNAYWIEVFDFQVSEKRGPSIQRFNL